MYVSKNCIYVLPCAVYNAYSFKQRDQRHRAKVYLYRRQKSYNDFNTMNFLATPPPFLFTTIKNDKYYKKEKKIFLHWTAFKIPLFKVKDCASHQLVGSLIYLNLSRPDYSLSHYVSEFIIICKDLKPLSLKLLPWDLMKHSEVL